MGRINITLATPEKNTRPAKKKLWTPARLNHNYTMRIDYMMGDKICTRMYVDFKGEKIEIENHTDKLLRRAFGVIENPTWEDFELFLQDRVFPKTRGDAKKLLKILDLPFYDPLSIAEKTKGRVAEDPQYLKFAYRTPKTIFWRAK